MIKELCERDVWLRVIENQIRWSVFHFRAEIMSFAPETGWTRLGHLHSQQHGLWPAYSGADQEETTLWYGGAQMAAVKGVKQSRIGWMDGLGSFTCERPIARFQGEQEALTIKQRHGCFWSGRQMWADIYLSRLSPPTNEFLLSFRPFPFQESPTLLGKLFKPDAPIGYDPLFDPENRSKFCGLPDNLKAFTAVSAMTYCVDRSLSQFCVS